jgi:hypothetical protein
MSIPASAHRALSLAAIATLVFALAWRSMPEPARPVADNASTLLPESHHGAWSGINRLWGPELKDPERSEGTIQCTDKGIEYTWSKGGKKHSGTISLHGQPAALRLAFEDTYHAGKGMTLHGHVAGGVVRGYGTYATGPGRPEWGWIIELDTRDPESLVFRMFNVVPGMGPVPAVVLHGKRSG